MSDFELSETAGQGEGHAMPTDQSTHSLWRAMRQIVWAVGLSFAAIVFATSGYTQQGHAGGGPPHSGGGGPPPPGGSGAPPPHGGGHWHAGGFHGGFHHGHFRHHHFHNNFFLFGGFGGWGWGPWWDPYWGWADYYPYYPSYPYYYYPLPAFYYPPPAGESGYQPNCQSGPWRRQDGSIISGTACLQPDGTWRMAY